MYNSTRSIFPTYTGLSDIKVSLPAPPTRNSLARGVDDLWAIRNSQPHINVLTDPGVAAPLPDNGYNPETELTETSPANLLVNRGSQPISQQERESLTDRLDDLYTEYLTANLQMSGMNVGEIKEYMNENTPGALLVYNGSDKDNLIKAYTIVQALEKLVDLCDRESIFTNIVKGQLVGFVSCCRSIRDALLLPNHMIRQKLFGSTESRNELEIALSAYGLSDDEVDARNNPKDQEFKDYHQAIELCDLELDNCANEAIESGIAQKAMDNALRQVTPHISSTELKKALHSTVNHVKDIANKKSQKGGKHLQSILDSMRADLRDLGVDPEFVSRLQRKQLDAKRLADKKRHRTNVDTDAANNAKRSPRNVQAASQLLKQMHSQLLQVAQQRGLDPLVELAMKIELYTVMCMQDCCIMLASGQPRLRDCAENLHGAVCEELKNSKVHPFRSLKQKSENAHNDLQAKRKATSLEKLNQAQSENAISDKKLKTLTTLLG
jgi:hypothetical protein